MAVNKVMLEAIEQGVAALPIMVRWYAPEELIKMADETISQETVQETIETIRTFVVLREWIELMKDDEALDRVFQEIALRHNCIIFMQKDGCLLFRSRT
jgi:hypothetical protein